MSHYSSRRRSRERRHLKILRQLVPRPLRPREILESALRRRAKGRVQTGPFRGLQFAPAAEASLHPLVLLGVFEKAIVPVVEKICAFDGVKVINIGASLGYYTVGFAFRNATIHSVGYETEPMKQQLIQDTAAMNGVAERVQVRGHCTRDELAREIDDRSVVFCDCEGAELILLDPLRIPALSRIPIFVEVHEFIIPGMEQEMIARFEATHTIERIWDDAAPAPFIWSDGIFRWIPARTKQWAMTEPRLDVTPWLWMQPRTSGKG